MNLLSSRCLFDWLLTTNNNSNNKCNVTSRTISLSSPAFTSRWFKR